MRSPSPLGVARFSSDGFDVVSWSPLNSLFLFFFSVFPFFFLYAFVYFW